MNDGSDSESDRKGGDRSAPLRRRGLLVAAVLALVLVIAWVIQSRVGGAEAPAGANAPDYAVAVMQGGVLLKRFSVADLHALPAAAVTIDGKQQDGPSLPTVLAAAGAVSFTTLTVKGAGVRDDGVLTLPAAQAGDSLVLDFSDRGTVKICSPDLAWADWVRDVKEIDLD